MRRRTFSILVLVFIPLAALLSCKTPPSGETASTEAPVTGPGAVDTPAPVGEPPVGPAPTEDSGEMGEDPVDPLEETARLFRSGDVEGARIRFAAADTRSLKSGTREAEWKLWRSRLFTSRWGPDELGLAGGDVSALLLDADDVWMGTWTGGINRYSSSTAVNTTFDRGETTIAVRTVNRIVREGESIWVVRYGIVERYDRRRSVWSEWTGLPENERLQDVAIVDSRFFLATLGRGFWLREDGQWRRLGEFGTFITRLERTEAGGLMVGTMDRGLFVIDAPGENTLPDRPPDGPLRKVNVTSMVETGGRVYVGTYGEGFYVWDRETGMVSKLGTEVPGTDWVLTMALSPRRLYLGTFGEGIAVLDRRTRTWDNISIADGLPVGDVSALAWRPGALWAGTLGGGIVKIDERIHDL